MHTYQLFHSLQTRAHNRLILCHEQIQRISPTKVLHAHNPVPIRENQQQPVIELIEIIL